MSDELGAGYRAADRCPGFGGLTLARNYYNIVVCIIYIYIYSISIHSCYIGIMEQKMEPAMMGLLEGGVSTLLRALGEACRMQFWQRRPGSYAELTRSIC